MKVIKCNHIIDEMLSHRKYSYFSHRSLTKISHCYHETYQMPINKSKYFRINLYTLTDHVNHYLKIIKYICDLYIQSKYKNSQTERLEQINIYLFPIYKKNKSLPNTNTFKPLSVQHVNSGYCILQGNHRNVYVFRQEEYMKVLIHELIHAFDLDSRFYNLTYPEIRSTLKINVNEAYTELLALIVYSKLFNIDIYQQLQFSIFQTAKILNYYGLNSLTDLYDQTFYQKSHILSYYVLKTSALYNLLMNQSTGFVSGIGSKSITVHDSLISKLLKTSKLDFIDMCSFKSDFIQQIDMFLDLKLPYDRSLELSI